jgi:D-3-phosphoglycerate dehydrogenase
MKVVIADKAERSLIEGLEGLGCDVHLDPSLDGDSLGACLAERQPEVLVVRSTKVPAGVIAKGAPALKMIIRAGSGYDNIDGKAAHGQDVAVCNTPGMNAVAVAELAMGHLISLDRRLCDQNSQMKGGRWNKKEFSNARGLKGSTLLVVGAGAIGREVVTRAKAFGIRVSIFDPNITAGEVEQLGVDVVDGTRAALLEALPGFDAVSMHVPAIDSTKGMCDAAFFGAMKDGALFINTSRGAIVDEPALIAAVQSGKIRAGLDVYANQPSDKDTPWETPVAKLDGVYCSHHCGASTDQAQLAVADEVVRMVGLYKADRAIVHCVNGVA